MDSSDPIGVIVSAQAEVKALTREQKLERACLRIARQIREYLEEWGHSDTRFFEAPYLRDELTVVGRSVAPGDRRHREHVVPRLYVLKKCLEMIADNRSDVEVADFIQTHIKIVLISTDERDLLDLKSNHGLKQTMPIDWSVGDCVFRRLQIAGIHWEKYELAPSARGVGTGEDRRV